MIPFSCADYTFPLLSRSKRFALLQLLDFNYVDIGLFDRNSGLRPAELAASPSNFTRQLKGELEGSGLRASDLFLQIGLEPAISAANDPSPHVRSHNRKIFLLALELCSVLNCKHLTGLPGVRHDDVAEADDFALAIEEAGWRQQMAADAGIAYAIEPHLGSLCFDVARTRTLIDAVPGLTLTLDYGHFIARHIPSGAVHALLPYASHIHVRGSAPGRLQTPVSESQVDFDGMLQRLCRQKYSGLLAVEYVWNDWLECNRADNVSETLLLRASLDEMQNANGQ